MKIAERKVIWNTSKGTRIECVITSILGQVEEDGWIDQPVKIKKFKAETKVRFWLDGQEYSPTAWIQTFETRQTWNAPGWDLGLRARYNNIGITQENLDRINQAISECESEIGLDIWKNEKREKENLEAKHLHDEEQEKIKNGWCPKCQSYCYGDCQSN